MKNFEIHQDRSGQPDVLMGQSIVLSEIKAEIPLQNENRNRLSRRREAAPPEDNGHTRAAM